MFKLIEIILLLILVLTPFTENVCDLDLESATPTTFLYESICTIEASTDNIIDLAESYAVDKSNSEMFLYVSCISLLRDVLRIFTIILPFIDDAESCNIALIVCDSFMLRAFYAIRLTPIFMYTTLCNMIT
jgi:hypothetical protein